MSHPPSKQVPSRIMPVPIGSIGIDPAIAAPETRPTQEEIDACVTNFRARQDSAGGVQAILDICRTPANAQHPHPYTLISGWLEMEALRRLGRVVVECRLLTLSESEVRARAALTHTGSSRTKILPLGHVLVAAMKENQWTQTDMAEMSPRYKLRQINEFVTIAEAIPPGLVRAAVRLSGLPEEVVLDLPRAKLRGLKQIEDPAERMIELIKASCAAIRRAPTGKYPPVRGSEESDDLGPSTDVGLDGGRTDTLFWILVPAAIIGSVMLVRHIRRSAGSARIRRAESAKLRHSPPGGLRRPPPGRASGV